MGLRYSTTCINIDNNVRIIQKFCKHIAINNSTDIMIDIDNDKKYTKKTIKRAWIRCYPKESIKDSILFAYKKLPKLYHVHDIIEPLYQLKQLINKFDKTKKNENYFINEYVQILTCDQLLAIGF